MKRSAVPTQPEDIDKARRDVEGFLAARGPTMGRDYERIQTTLFSLDVGAEFERLSKALSFGGRASQREYGELLDELDRADDNAWRAKQVAASARVALESFEADAEPIEAALRAECLAELERQKSVGDRKKAIHEPDVRALMAERHPTEVRDLGARRARAKRTVELLDALAERWVDRARHLDTMVRASRK